MKRIDSVLALTDFSAPARHAAERAAMVARDTAATLDLLHVSQQHRSRLVDLAREVGLDDADWLPRVLVGAPRHNILEQEQEGDCDLIVVGKHGESTLEDLILGCVTKQVLTEAQADVLVAV